MRVKHQKGLRGYKKVSKGFLNQSPILGDKGMIYTTPASNGNYYFRTWLKEEKKYYRIGLRTKDRKEAITIAEQEMVDILSKVRMGHKIYGYSWTEICDDFLSHTKDRVDTGRITPQRLATIKTQITKWIVPYIGKNIRLSELDRNSFLDYAMWRRKETKNEVTDVTIRNEYTTVNAIIKFAERKGAIPFGRVDTEEIKITEPSRRDTFTPEEYKVFYTKMRMWVDDSVDPHELYYRSLIRDFILIKSNAFPRFGELMKLKWGMCKVITHKREKMLQLDLPKEICKNRKSRTVLSRGGRYLERIKSYTENHNDDDFVFTHMDRNTVLSKQVMYKYWGQVLAFSGLDKIGKKLTYYSLRHFGITARLYAKVPYFDVSKLAGTSVKFIEDHYAHLDLSKLMDSATRTFKISKDGFIVRED